MTYVNAVKYLSACPTYIPSPERMRLLCRYLGEPQRQMRFVHIAGGSGKTSCSIMLSLILSACGYKIGRLNSPFTREHREMISVCDSPLPHNEFAIYISQVAVAVEKMKADIKAAAENPESVSAEAAPHPKITKNLLEGKITPEPIADEVICAAAFLAFRENNCNIALLECGDSRADPTGIIDPPLVSVICGSAFTEEQLRTGAGIVRRGTREVVTSAPAGVAYNAILDACVRTGSRLTVPAVGDFKLISQTLGGKQFEYRGKEYSFPSCAEYQLLNLLVSIETVYALRRTGVALHSADVADGITRARIPLRFEFISVAPAVIVDCPATTADLQSLCDSLFKISSFIGKKLIIVTSQDDDCVAPYAFESRGFAVTELLTPATEADDKRTAERALSLNSDETMLVLGKPMFSGRVARMIKKYFACR